MNKFVKALLFAVIIFLFTPTLFAGNVSKSLTPNLGQYQSILNNRGLSFTENKGQLADKSGKLLSDILYYGTSKGLDIYCTGNKIEFVFVRSSVNVQNAGPIKSISKARSFENDTFYASRMEMNFKGANSNSQIVAGQQTANFTNYNAGGKNITNVASFKTLTYKNIYNNIDLVLQSKAEGMEYEFLVHPGGKVSDIQIQWTGADQMQATENGGIRYTSSLGEINETKPTTYLSDGIIESSSNVNDNTVSFRVGKYDETQTLVIDPVISWSTYYGGGYEAGQGIASDASNNIYVTGYTSSSSGIATSGAYQTTIAGSLNAFVAKFTSNGSLAWATYFGGGNLDQGFAVVTDAGSNVYVAGTSSSSGIATSGAYQTSNGGHYDAFLAKFTSSGSLTWATYYGGDYYDFAYGVALDGNNGVYISGTTSSDNGIATPGAYDTALTGGSFGFFNSAFLAKFTTSGSLKWGTYYGGLNTNGYGIATDGNHNIYITGYTENNFNISTSAAFQASYGGNGDAFLAKFTSSGSLSWGTYYGGSQTDGGQGLVTDAGNNIYMIGYTGSSNAIATGGAYQTSYAGGIDFGDVFLAKFSSSGSRTWATYYGGNSDDVGLGIAKDANNNLYLTGYTESTNGIATSGAYKTAFYGGFNAFLAQFTTSGSFSWGTYLGGANTDEANAIVCDKNNNVYITGYATSDSLATSGAYQTSLAGGSGSQNAFIARFITVAAPTITVSLSKTSYIAGDNVNVTATLSSPYNTDNNFTIQMSGPDGSFASPYTLGVRRIYYSRTFSLIIPFTAPNGSHYRFRVIASDPVDTSNDNGSDITIRTYCFIRPTECGMSYELGDTIRCITVYTAGATGYKFRLVNSSNSSDVHTYFSSTNYAPLSSFSPSLSYGTTYNASVQVYNGSAAGSWGDSSCTISTYSLSNLVSSKLGTNQCGNKIFVTFLNAIRKNVKGYIFKVYSDASCTNQVGNTVTQTSGILHNGALGTTLSSNTKYYITIQTYIDNHISTLANGDTCFFITSSGGFFSVGPHTSGDPSIQENINLAVYPNPFTSQTTISYTLPENSEVTATVFDMMGKQVATLCNENQMEGNYQLEFNTEKYHVLPGVYFLRVTINGNEMDKTIIKVN